MLVEEQHLSSGPKLVSIYINFFKIEALVSQSLHQKESMVNNLPHTLILGSSYIDRDVSDLENLLHAMR